MLVYYDFVCSLETSIYSETTACAGSIDHKIATIPQTTIDASFPVANPHNKLLIHPARKGSDIIANGLQFK